MGKLLTKMSTIQSKFHFLPIRVCSCQNGTRFGEICKNRARGGGRARGRRKGGGLWIVTLHRVWDTTLEWIQYLTQFSLATTERGQWTGCQQLYSCQKCGHTVREKVTMRIHTGKIPLNVKPDNWKPFISEIYNKLYSVVFKTDCSAGQP